jgi:hypothetical protein
MALVGMSLWRASTARNGLGHGAVFECAGEDEEEEEERAIFRVAHHRGECRGDDHEHIDIRTSFHGALQ